MVEERNQDEARQPGDGDAQSDDDASGQDIYTVANIITVLRLVLVPIFFAVLIEGDNDVLAFVLFVIAASTDWLDGQIARRTGTVTALGKAIDPLVDRLLIAAGVLGLYLTDRLPLWPVLILVARDLYLLWGAWRLETRYHKRLPVSTIGKWTTAVLLVGFSLLILDWPTVPGLGLVESPALPGFGSDAAPLGMWLLYGGMVLSLAAAVQYTVEANRAVATLRAQGREEKRRGRDGGV